MRCRLIIILKMQLRNFKREENKCSKRKKKKKETTKILNFVLKLEEIILR